MAMEIALTSSISIVGLSDTLNVVKSKFKDLKLTVDKLNSTKVLPSLQKDIGVAKLNKGLVSLPNVFNSAEKKSSSVVKSLSSLKGLVGNIGTVWDGLKGGYSHAVEGSESFKASIVGVSSAWNALKSGNISLAFDNTAGSISNATKGLGSLQKGFSSIKNIFPALRGGISHIGKAWGDFNAATSGLRKGIGNSFRKSLSRVKLSLVSVTVKTYIARAALASFSFLSKISTPGFNAMRASLLRLSTTKTFLAIKSLLLAGAMQIGAAAMWLFNAAMSANPIGLIIVGIIALVTAGYMLIKNWTSVKDFFGNIFSWIYDKFWFLFIPIKLFIGAVKLIIKHWSSIKGFFGNIFSWIYDKFWFLFIPINLLIGAVKLIINSWTSIKDFFGNIVDWIYEKFSFLSIPINFLIGVVNVIINAWSSVYDFFAGLFDWMYEKFAWIGDTVSSVLGFVGIGDDEEEGKEKKEQKRERPKRTKQDDMLGTNALTKTVPKITPSNKALPAMSVANKNATMPSYANNQTKGSRAANSYHYNFSGDIIVKTPSLKDGRATASSMKEAILKALSEIKEDNENRSFAY